MTSNNNGNTDTSTRGRHTWSMIATVIALTAIAIVLVPNDQPAVVDVPPLDTEMQPTLATAEPSPAQEAQALPAANAAPEPAAPVVEDNANEISSPAPEAMTAARPEAAPGQAARAFIAGLHGQGRDDPDAAWAEAEKHRLAAHLQDAYLLYFYAARLGHAEAALALATQADPAYHAADSSALAKPDIPFALKWYKEAAAAGSRTGEMRLATLRARIEQLAAEGDEQAQRLVMQWQ